MNTFFHGDQAAKELMDRLMGTTAYLRGLAERRELTNPQTIRSELKGIRQRMARDVEAIDEYLKTYTDKKEEM